MVDLNLSIPLKRLSLSCAISLFKGASALTLPPSLLKESMELALPKTIKSVSAPLYKAEDVKSMKKLLTLNTSLRSERAGRALTIDLDYFPDCVLAIADTIDAARVEMKRPVLIKRRSCNTTENSQDREIVTYYDSSFFGLMAPDDPVHPGPRPFLHIDQPLPSGKKQLRGLASPLFDEIGICSPNLAER
jgi:hypothetical protein